jgi:hypothetical protein
MIIRTWNTVPDYDEWGFDTYWDCDHWMQWHKELKNKFGDDRAKYIWEYAFEKGSAFSKHWDCRSFNREFRAYVAKEKLNPYKSTPLEILVRPIGIGTDVVGGAFDVVEGIGRNTKTILTIGLVLATAYFGFKAYKSLKEA